MSRPFSRASGSSVIHALAVVGCGRAGSAIPVVEMRHSSGMIVFRGKTMQTLEFLVLRSKKQGTWSPAKGHNNAGEGDRDAAVRELREETRLEPEHYAILPNFEGKVTYQTSSDTKTVTLFLAELKDQAPLVRLSEEHQAYAWATFDDACKQIKHEEVRAVMVAARKFLNESGGYGKL